MMNDKVGALVMMMALSFGLCACSESSGEEDDYANWQQRNEAAIDQWAANSSYRKIKTYTKNENEPGVNSDYIYVEVLEAGTGTETPLFTDSCRVAYRGRLIPTTSYPEGYVFDQDFLGDFSWETAGVYEYVPGIALVDGFATALQNMHKGDYWRVYIPYTLGYGSSASGSIPAYSNLVFDIALFDFWHPGENRPDFKSRQR